MAGRKPKPTAVKKLEGNQGKRKLNTKEPNPGKGMPDCPAWLLPEAKTEWIRLSEILNQMGVLTEIDRSAFSAYCQSYARWKEAQEIRLKRTAGMHRDGVIEKRERYSRKYAFSSMCKCGFCGDSLTRRILHSNSIYEKPVWYCHTAANVGKSECPHSKSIDEKILEGAFVEAYKLLADGFDDVFDSVLDTVKEVVSDDKLLKRLDQVNKDVSKLESRKNKLLDMLLDETIDREDYEEKLAEIEKKLKVLIDERKLLSENVKEQKNTGKRMEELRNALAEDDVIDEFDRLVFESIVDKVILGAELEDGSIDPFKITFVFKGCGKSEIENVKKRYRYRNKDNDNTSNKANNVVIEKVTKNRVAV